MGGFFGITGRANVTADLFYGTDYHSHLGTQRGGMALLGDGGFQRSIHDIRNAQFRSKFEDDLPRLRGEAGIGVISDYEDQPLLIGSHLGAYAIVTVGVVRNLDALAAKAFRRRSHFSEMSGGEINPTELVATLVNEGANLAEGIRMAQQQIEGSCSILVLSREGLYAARDLRGRTPIVVAAREDAYAAASESCALPNLGFRAVRDLGPGEVVRLTPDGVETLLPPLEEMKICAFLWVYYGYPASTYEGHNVETVRNECGACLARREKLPLDLVAGIPDSGIAHGLGYASEAGLPYRRPFVKYTPTWPRSFMPQNQEVRDLVARMKLIPIPELIRGRRLLFCEDSIVRGTQLKDTIRRLFDAGAAEVHMRPACPPLMFGCPYLNFSRSRSALDLAARRAVKEIDGSDDPDLQPFLDPEGAPYAAMCDRIRGRLGLTTLVYQRLDDMLGAIGLPPCQVCTYCWNGRG
jgi:amidophosphoribosyltransferase